MRIILLERVAKLGQIGDIVDVKPGYARNFLIPRKKASPATAEHIEAFKIRKSQIEAHNLETKNEALKILEKVENIKPAIMAQASETKQLYGSVKARDIVDAIAKQGVTISHKQVILLPIKTLGLHRVKIDLHPEVETSILVCVATNDEEAEILWEAGEIANEVTPQANEQIPALVDDGDAAGHEDADSAEKEDSLELTTEASS